MNRQIDFYYDVVSPFAHVALARFDELPDDVTVKPVPVLLGAILSHWGQRGPAEIGPKRLQTYRQAVFLGRQAGLLMRFPPRHPFNPLGALRILAGADADVETVRRALAFVFEDGRCTDDAAGLEAFAARLGLPVELATDDRAKAALRENTDRAIADGVFGVPTFTLRTGHGTENFWGTDSIPLLAARLADPDLFENEPYKHLEAVEVGVARKA